VSRFSDQFLDELRSRLPVSEVVGKHLQLKKEGAEYVALSPFQNEKTPSFKVNDGKHLWKDFASGKGGDIFKFEMEITGCDFPTAVERCAQLAGMPLPGKNSSTGKAPSRGAKSPDADEFENDPRFSSTQPLPESEHPNAPRAAKPRREITATYDYLNADEMLIYQVVRFQWEENGKRKKSFAQRQPAPGEKDTWIWGLDSGEFMRKRKGSGDWRRFDEENFKNWRFEERKKFDDIEIAHSIYRLPELMRELAAIKDDEDMTCFLPEGEKDVHTFLDWKLAGFCNSGGAKNWKPHHAEMFRGLDVVVPIDNDEAGRLRGEKVCASLRGIARRVRLLDPSSFWIGCPKGGDITDWRDQAGGTREKLLEIVDRLEDWKPRPFESKFGAVRFDDPQGSALAPEWLIKYLLPMGDVVLVIGESQSGKSFLVSHIAMHVALGWTFENRKTVQRGVVYCAAEKGKGHRNRMRGWRMFFQVSQTGVPFAVTTKPFDLFTEEAECDALIAEIKGLAAPWEEAGIPLGLVVIDTHDAATPDASEVDKKEVMRVKKRYERIRDETGATVLIIQHKNASGGLRGNQVLYNNIETCIDVSKMDDGSKEKNLLKDTEGRPIKRATVKKQSEGEAGWHWDFVLRQVEIGRDADGDAITTCVVDTPGGHNPASTSPKVRAVPPGYWDLKPNARRVFVALKEALERKGVVAPDGVRCPLGAICVRVGDWREELDRIRAGEYDGKDMEAANKKTIQRAIDNWMGDDRIIGKDGEWVWRTRMKIMRVDAEPLKPLRESAADSAPGDDDEVPF